jgi:Immunity protein 7
MFEYHGWVCLRATPEVDDFDAKTYSLPEIERLLDAFGRDYGLVDLRPLNGTYFMHIAGMPNHRGHHGPAAIRLLRDVGQAAPGSYGLLYVLDDEHPEHNNEFRVFRLTRGDVTEHADPFLSPTIPTLEDEWIPPT